MDIEELKRWYFLNGKPTRDKVRNGEVSLPEGASQSLVEALIPEFRKEADAIERNSNCTLTTKEEKSIVITSDWHIPFEDKEALNLFLKFAKEYQPDELILNGNINDCTSFSTHPKIREVARVLRSAREERDLWLPIADILRSYLPSAKITYIGSQCHEGWIDKWTSLSPILAEDDNYTIKNWFRLDDYGIDFKEEVYDINNDGTFLVTHGTVARSKGGNSAHAELDMSGTNIAIGHTHRLSQVYKTNAVGTYVGFETGCLCQRKPWYVVKGRRRMMDWQQGFVLLNFKDNSFGGNVVPIIRDGKDKPYIWIGKEIIK